MTEPRATPERIDLRQAEDPRDVVHRAVACLAQGGVVGLPTEAVYGVMASAHQPSALHRLGQLARGGPAPEAPMLWLKGADEIADWVPRVSLVGRRLASRAWPGPVTLQVSEGWQEGLVSRLIPEARQLVAGPEGLNLSSPSHQVGREIVRLLPGPVVLATSPSAREAEPPIEPDALAARTDLDMILTDGATQWGGWPTVVRLEGAGWSIARPGVVDAASLRRMVATVVLFVCTGNTCRSPMAEALCRVLLAERLGCAADALEVRGFVVLSAGVAAAPGMPATAEAAEVVRAWGASLREHVSQRVTLDLVRQADVIVTMTRDHRDALLAHVPEAASRTRLLHPQGGDVADPIGGDRALYRRTAQEIEEYLRCLLDEIGLASPSAT